MRFLLDSHVALWWLADDPRLGTKCRAAMTNADEVYFSAVTPWELGIKQALGKLRLPGSISAALEEAGFSPLSIFPDHAEAAAALPAVHRDPFDRMLVAQAQMELLTLVSDDAQLQAYDVSILTASD